MALKAIGGTSLKTKALDSSKATGRSVSTRGASRGNTVEKNLTRRAVNPSVPTRAVGTSTPKTSSSTAKSSSSGTGTSPYSSLGNSYGSTGDSDLSVETPTSTVPTEEDYLAGDATYQATLSALAKQLQGFQTDIDSQRATRKLDYDQSLKDLGYGADGSWNWTDGLTASGRAYQNLVNDAASRGTLQSSGYADSLNDLTRALTDQYNGINTSNTQYNSDLDRQLTKAKDENTAASQSARAEAIMRRAAQYGFTS